MKEITKKEFTGIFKEEFENFLRYKNALGYYKKIEETFSTTIWH